MTLWLVDSPPKVVGGGIRPSKGPAKLKFMPTLIRAWREAGRAVLNEGAVSQGASERGHVGVSQDWNPQRFLLASLSIPTK